MNEDEMVVSTNRNKNSWLRIWKSIIPNPKFILRKGVVMGWSWPEEFQTMLTPRGTRTLTEGRTGEKEFFENNFGSFVKVGIVFGGKFHGYYPWRYCDPHVAIPIELVKNMLKAEFGAKIDRPGIVNMMKGGLLPSSESVGLPLYAKDRIILVTECRRRFGYSESQLRQIAEYEDGLLKHLADRYVPYDECDLLNVAARKNRRCDNSSGQARCDNGRHHGKQSPFDQAARKLVRLSADELGWVPPEAGDVSSIADFMSGDVDFDLLSKRNRDAVKFQAELMAFIADDVRLAELDAFREGILGGYSPQIVLRQAQGRLVSCVDVGEAQVNWNEAKVAVRGSNLSFVRIPTFMMTQEEKEINIRILEPESVDAPVIDKIGQLYNAFRKRLKPPRTPWGEKTGIRKEKQGMYQLLRRTYDKKKAEKKRKRERFTRFDIYEEMRDELGISLADDSMPKAIRRGRKKG